MRTLINFEESVLYYLKNDSAVNLQELIEKNPPFVETTIPSNVDLSLEKAGVLPALFHGTNILELEKWELSEFWYKLRFCAKKGKKTSLVFEGVDTVAEYYLNGQKIGESKNMFIPHSFDVTDILREENELYVCLRSPVLWAMDKEYDTGSWNLSYNAESVYLRKAPHTYGWDICPRNVNGGIFRPVYLEEREDVAIDDVYMHTLSIDHNGAHIRLSYDITASPTLFHNANFTIEGKCDGASFHGGERVVFKHGAFNITVPKTEIRFWNPKGYGEQNLYEITAKIVDFSGKVLAKKQFRFGLRLLELDWDKTGEKNKFCFLVNGVKIMVKGTNWVPLDAYHSRDNERMARALALLDESGCNMVRCWGGNVYETEEFFDFCDEHGIMIWQDFAFACNLYPCEESFYEEIRKEVPYVVKYMRKHPSLALYCGDNECDLGMYFNGYSPDAYAVTRRILPELLFRYDPFRTFLPSSPYYAHKNVRLAEDHLWGPRDNFKSPFYLNDKASFVSEIGYHGCPSVESIRKFISKEYVWPWENDEWMAHQTVPGGQWTKDWNRNKLMVEQVRELFGKVPDDLETFSIASQISQAEALKFFIENTRLKKWKKTGLMWWNLLDCWPQFSDAVVDYYFNEKLAFAYVKQSQKPLLLMLNELHSWHLKATIGNDGCNDYQGKYRILDGETGEVIVQGEFLSKANENEDITEFWCSRSQTRFFFLELEADGCRCVNHYVHLCGNLGLERYRKFMENYARFVKDGSV